jgi:predicted kinase
MICKLVVFAGPPCSGKSGLADVVQRELGIRWLQVDRILSTLMPNSQRGKADRELGYRAMHLIGEYLLGSNCDVIFDATYSRVEPRREVESLAMLLSVPLYLVELQVSPDVAVARFKNRTSHPASDLSEERVREIAQFYRYSNCGLVVNADESQAISIEQVDGYLRAGKNAAIDGVWSNSASGYLV